MNNPFEGNQFAPYLSLRGISKEASYKIMDRFPGLRIQEKHYRLRRGLEEFVCSSILPAEAR